LGDLVLPIAALIVIEEASHTSEELQTNFDIVDECSSKSSLIIMHIPQYWKPHWIFVLLYFRKPRWVCRSSRDLSMRRRKSSCCDQGDSDWTLTWHICVGKSIFMFTQSLIECHYARLEALHIHASPLTIDTAEWRICHALSM
jgi:hypothetical protein